MTETIEAAAEIIRARAGSTPIEMMIVLGSGLGAAMDNAVENAVSFSYAELPGFPETSVPGHEGRLTLGNCEGVRIACLSGRAHYYEKGDLNAMGPAFATIARLGAKTSVLTCSAGSVNADIAPGTLVMITDHVNLSGLNPLIGAGPDAHFIAMTDAYDPGLNKRLRRAAIGGGVPMREGLYMWFPGPSFETPAEVRVARTLGADLVGMSIVPEVILARRLAIRVAAVAIVTNFGAGFQNGNPNHAHNQEVAHHGSIGLKRLLRAFFKTRDNAWGAGGRELLR